MSTQNRYIKHVMKRCDASFVDTIVNASFDITINTSSVAVLVHYNRDLIKNFNECRVELNEYGHVTIWITTRIKMIFV